MHLPAHSTTFAIAPRLTRHTVKLQRRNPDGQVHELAELRRRNHVEATEERRDRWTPEVVKLNLFKNQCPMSQDVAILRCLQKERPLVLAR